MQAKRWKKEECLLTLSAKLCEEAAEVSKEITKARFRKKGLNKSALLEEIEHVELMTQILRKRVKDNA